MKKSNILIAVFAVIVAAASVAMAGGPQINFDGRNIGTGAVSFTEAVKAIESADIAMAAVPAPIPVKAAASDMKKEEAELNRSIGTAIKDCEKKEFAGLKAKFEKLLAEGLLQEKRDFVYNNKQTYEFPRRLFTVTAKADAASNQRKVNKACLTWGSKEVCTTGRKEVCHNVCAASTLVCIAVVGVAAPVCTWAPPICALACAFVDDTKCTMVDYCVAQDTYDGNNDPWGPQPGVAPRYNQ